MQKISGPIRSETMKQKTERFDRDFVPLGMEVLERRPKPVAEACNQSDDRDMASKEMMAQWVKGGSWRSFHEALEARETLYYRSFWHFTVERKGPATNIVMWHALQDLCQPTSAIAVAGQSTTDLSVCARHYRWLRVRDVLRAEREDRVG